MEKRELTLVIGETRLDDAERRIVLDTIDYFDGNKTLAADVLGVSLKTIYNKLERYAKAA